jgi:hypothetical protein
MKSRIGPFLSARSWRIAVYSTMRFFTLSRPRWSSSRQRRTSFTSMRSGVVLRPGQVGDPLEVRLGDVELGGLLRHRPQAAELLLRDLLDVGGDVRAQDAVAQLLDLVVVAALAQLFLDGLHLLAEDVLALALAHLLLHHESRSPSSREAPRADG